MPLFSQRIRSADITIDQERVRQTRLSISVFYHFYLFFSQFSFWVATGLAKICRPVSSVGRLPDSCAGGPAPTLRVFK